MKKYMVMFSMLATILCAQQDVVYDEINKNIETNLLDQQFQTDVIKPLLLKEIVSLINDESLEINNSTVPLCMYVINNRNELIALKVKEWINGNYSCVSGIKHIELSQDTKSIQKTDKKERTRYSKNSYVCQHTVVSKNTTKHITLLGLAVLKNNKMLISYLVRFGADINDYYCDYCYPLHNAVQLHHLMDKPYIDTVLLLLSLGANYNIQNGTGATALCLAVCDGNCDIVELLLEFGVNPNIADFEGYSPLHWAVFPKYFEFDKRDKCNLINQLLGANADINAQNKYGQTPLMLSTFFDFKDETNLLIKKGASKNIKDNSGVTVAEIKRLL